MCYSRVVSKAKDVAWHVTDKVGHVGYWIPVVTILYTVILINATGATRKG